MDRINYKITIKGAVSEVAYQSEKNAIKVAKQWDKSYGYNVAQVDMHVYSGTSHTCTRVYPEVGNCYSV